MSKIEVRRPVSDWAKLPIDWIREGGPANFADESYSQKSMWMKCTECSICHRSQNHGQAFRAVNTRVKFRKFPT